MKIGFAIYFGSVLANFILWFAYSLWGSRRWGFGWQVKGSIKDCFSEGVICICLFSILGLMGIIGNWIEEVDFEREYKKEDNAQQTSKQNKACR